MRSIANERLDIIVNLSKLINAEIRDERGITKLVIPISAAGLKLTEAGNIHLKLSAMPMKDNAYGATHCIKVASPACRYKDKRGKDIIGSVYLYGKHEFDEKKAAEYKAKRNAKERELERVNKYKGLDF